MGTAAILMVDERRRARRAIARPSTLRAAAGKAHDIVIDNLSVSGCAIKGNLALEPGEEVSIGLPGIGVRWARIIWARDEMLGCVFLRPLTEAQLDILSSDATLPPILAFPEAAYGAEAPPPTELGGAQASAPMFRSSALAALIGLTLLSWGLVYALTSAAFALWPK